MYDSNYLNPAEIWEIKLLPLPSICQMSSIFCHEFLYLNSRGYIAIPLAVLETINYVIKCIFVHITENSPYYCGLLQTTYFKLKCFQYLSNQSS